MTPRLLALLGVMLLAGGLLWSDGPTTSDDLALPVARSARTPAATPAMAAALPRRAGPVMSANGEAMNDPPRELPGLRPRGEPERSPIGERNLFAAKSWAPPPLPPTATASAAPPVAAPPPLPFQYIGRQRSGGTDQVFLAEGEQVHVVQLHSVIRGTYRVDQVSPAALVLTYLPMNLTQRITTGSID